MKRNPVARLLGLVVVVLVVTAGMSGCSQESKSCEAAAEAPGPTDNQAWGVSQGTVGEAHGIKIGMVSSSCENGAPTARVWVSTKDGDVKDATVRAGEIIDYAGNRLFVSSITKPGSDRGHVTLLRLQD